MSRRVLLGITGGIAAYKTPELVRLLRKEGNEVRVMMTENATRLVAPHALATVSGGPVALSLFEPHTPFAMGHIELAMWADIAVVAPATANFLGKLAAGIADNLLQTTMLALRPETPLVVAPAMNNRMWNHPAVQRSLATVAADHAGRFVQVGPAVGELACGGVAIGVMAGPEEIARAVCEWLMVDG